MNTALQATPQTAFAGQNSWGQRITAAWQKQVPAILETGNLLISAKLELGHGNWLRMAKNQLPFGISTANKLMKIAGCDHFRDSDPNPHLPAAWVILFEVSQLTEVQFDQGIASGKINSKMSLKDAKSLRGDEPREPDVKKDSATSILKRQVEEHNRTIAHLQDQLATAEAGSLFDLKKDSVKDIVSVIVNEVHMGVISRNKALELADAIKTALKKSTA